MAQAPTTPKASSDEPKSSQSALDFDVSKPNTLKSLSANGARLPKFGMPKLGMPNFKLQRPTFTLKKRSLIWLCLLIILISYIFMGYFLSVLMTIPSQQNLAIASFVIVGLFPTLTAFADYALMKWSYMISGLLIVGGLVFLIRLKFYLTVLAISTWVGLTVIAFVGDVLSKKRKLWMAIAILTLPCLIGLGIGCQIWRLATQWS